MNTKGTRFLAVVAVMALAFTLFVALDPADESMATSASGVNVYDLDDDFVDQDEITSSIWSGDVTGDVFYVSEDTTVKMKSVDTDNVESLKFFVQNGAALTLDFKASWSDYATTPIYIWTVTGDQQANMYSTYAGKIPLDATLVTFQGVAGMSVYYRAATVDYEPDYDRTTSGVADFIKTEEPEIVNKAQFSADKAFTAAVIMEPEVAVADGQTIETANPINANLNKSKFDWGTIVYDEDATAPYTYYSPGANVGDVVLADDSDDSVWIISGKVTAKNGSSTMKIEKLKENKYDYTVTTVTIDDNENLVLGGNGYGSVAPTETDYMMAGEITASGDVSFKEYTYSDGTVTISNKANIAADSKIAMNGGTLVLKGETAANLKITGSSGTVKADNSKLWIDDAPTTGIKINSASTYSGLVDTSSITKTARMEKEISSSYIEINQTFELFGNTTVSNDLTVKGILIVDEGVTLTVDKGATISMDAQADLADGNCGQFAQIINYGTIIVKADTFGEGLFVNSGKLTNYGTISMTAKSTLTGTTTTSTLFVAAGIEGVANFGTITVSKTDYAFLKSFDNKVTGKLTVNGKFLGQSEITNRGSIVFNGADLTEPNTTVTVNNKGMFANFYISSAKLGDDTNKIVVTDTKTSYYDDENAIHKGNSALVIALTAVDITTSTIRGLTVSAAVDGDDHPVMVLNGGVTVSCDKKQVDIILLAMDNSAYEPETPGIEVTAVSVTVDAAKAQWTVTDYASGGNFAVADALSIPAYVKLQFGSATTAGVIPDDLTSLGVAQHVKLAVTGEMSFNKDAKARGDSYTVTDLYVDGLINCKESDFLSDANFVGAKVENSDGDVLYMPIEDAVAYAILNDINTVDVGYVATAADDADYPTITSNITIPAEMNVQTVTPYKYKLNGVEQGDAVVPAKI